MRDHLAILKRLTALIEMRNDPAKFEQWLDLHDSVRFLVDNGKSDSVILYLAAGHMFVHSVLAPTASVTPADFEDLRSWNGNPFSSWSTWTSGSEVGVSSPLSHIGSKTLAQGEQFLFIRDFEGVPDRPQYFELLQRFAQIFGLHYMAARNAWCRLDRFGDLEDVVKIVRVLGPAGTDSYGRVVFCSRDVLAQYAALTEATLVQLFDFTCAPPGQFGGGNPISHEERSEGTLLRYEYVRQSGSSCYARGVQITPIASPRREVADALWGRRKPEQYATFIAHDWKNNRVAEISCSPDALCNYFTKSDKPWEVTPAFFRPEVLLKYKADSEKYSLEHRSVGCRGAWHLQTFDINEASQVHTYLIYLSRLPYEEQLHWKQYNEPPKSPISKRAFATDFEGSWDVEYDPLLSLKAKLRLLIEAKVPWWKLRGEDLQNRVHYPVTTSPDEWAGELLNLDQLLVEGFDLKGLRAECEKRGGAPDVRLQSLALLEKLLELDGFEFSHAQKLVKPFRQLHELRSKVKGHAAGSGAMELRTSAMQEHGSLAQHFRSLAKSCDEALGEITIALSPRTAAKDK